MDTRLATKSANPFMDIVSGNTQLHLVLRLL
jgi:hypothetical protein